MSLAGIGLGSRPEGRTGARSGGGHEEYEEADEGHEDDGRNHSTEVGARRLRARDDVRRGQESWRRTDTAQHRWLVGGGGKEGVVRTVRRGGG
eukprot:2845731-Rhodomonas_salina.1